MITIPRMKNVRLPKASSFRVAAGGKTTVFVSWDRRTITYLVASPSSGNARPTWRGSGIIERDEDRPPIEQLAESLQASKIASRRLVVLLGRNELDVSNLQIPPASDEELPSLVTALIEQEYGEGDGDRVVDYTISQTHEDRSVAVLAFSQPTESLASLQQLARQHQFQLTAVLPRDLASLALLTKGATRLRKRTIVVTMGDQEFNIAILDRSKPVFLRSVRIREQDPAKTSERLSHEIQRSLAAVPDVDQESQAKVVLFGSVVDHDLLVEGLEEQLDLPVTAINPLDYLTTTDSTPTDSPDRMAAVVGAALDVFDTKPDVDLCHPREVPKPPNAIRRWIGLGVAVSVPLVVGISYLWSDRVALGEELEAKTAEFDSQAALANKMLEQADDVRAVQAWMDDDINWLDELRDLSGRLPGGDVATIRQLSGNVSRGQGTISLGVQVSHPEQVAELENCLRSEKHSVSSNRVSERSADDEYPWQFDTRVLFQGRSRTEYQQALAGQASTSNIHMADNQDSNESASSNPVAETADSSAREGDIQ